MKTLFIKMFCSKKMELYIDPVGPGGGHPGGSRSAPGPQKRPNIDFFNFSFLSKKKKHPKTKIRDFSLAVTHGPS